MEARKKVVAPQETPKEDIYIPPQATEEDFLDEVDQKLKDLYDSLKEIYGEEAPLISQLEAWKQRWGSLNVSKVGQDRDTLYVWRTLQRLEYKKFKETGSKKLEDEDAYNEMLVEQCLLYPKYDFIFRQKSDAGVITTLGTQIAYKSGFVSPQEALALIYVA